MYLEKGLGMDSSARGTAQECAVVNVEMISSIE
jgi:hypothetical protein